MASRHKARIETTGGREISADVTTARWPDSDELPAFLLGENSVEYRQADHQLLSPEVLSTLCTNCSCGTHPQSFSVLVRLSLPKSLLRGSLLVACPLSPLNESGKDAIIHFLATDVLLSLALWDAGMLPRGPGSV